jgi:spermidine/putrescine transport system permease protein
MGGGGRSASWALMAPGLLWLVALMVVPCLLIFALMFFERGTYGGVDWNAPTLDNIARAFDPLYASILWDSVRIASVATMLALLIGYPAAYAISKAPERARTALLFLAILPFWTNYLIRTYAWIVLLNPAGLINTALMRMSIISSPLPLLYNEFAVVLGLVYNYTPFVILAVYSALQRLDPSYAEASRDLGAGAWTTFRRITLPLTAAGVAAGAVFVFVLSIGNFVTPDLLGGGKLQMAGNLIYDQFLTARDWPFGATLSAILIALMMILLFLQALAAARAQGHHAAPA